MSFGADLPPAVPLPRQSDALSAFGHRGLGMCAAEALEPGRRFVRRAGSKAVPL